MAQAFEDHDLDDHGLYTHHIPLSECKSYMRTEGDGTQVEAIDAGQIAKSVKDLAAHEQINILQPAIYNDEEMKASLRLEQFACPPIADTPAWRAQLRDVNQGGTTYWQAGARYQVMLMVHLFADQKHPNEECYLISLDVGDPWIEP